MEDWQDIIKDWKDLIMEDYFPLKGVHKEMIEKLLYPSDSNPFHVERKYREILQRVLSNGFYTEADKEVLNYVRESYLKGKNWVK
jgi:hypothetical protein